MPTRARLIHSAWTVAAVVLLAYAFWLVTAFQGTRDPRDFIRIGHRFVFASHASSVITPDPRYHYIDWNDGYDGQFAYFIALDPVHARSYVDRVNYRYSRILYPMLARLLALGRSTVVPYTLLIVNWLALAAGTLAIAAWLRRRDLSPWYALGYALYPGLFAALKLDLTEPLAYALLALGIYLLDFGRVRRVASSGVCFGLAVLTRESTVVFPILFALASVTPALRRVLPRWTRRESASGNEVEAPRELLESGLGRHGPRLGGRAALVLLALSLSPMLLYKAFLRYWFGPGNPGVLPALLPSPIPFGGILSHWPWGENEIEEIVAIIAPALICAGIAIYGLLRGARSVEVCTLLVNSFLFVILLNHLSWGYFVSPERLATPVVVSALYCLPRLHELTGPYPIWLWASLLLWFAPLPSLLPFSGRAILPVDLMVVVLLVVALCRLAVDTTPRVALAASD